MDSPAGPFVAMTSPSVADTLSIMPRATETYPTAVYFGEILRRLRLQHGWTIRELARLSEMHPTYISALEKGANSPSLNTILLLAILFDADPGEWVREIAQRWKESSEARSKS
jgi:plasmid maintenance system antidote protein VapI